MKPTTNQTGTSARTIRDLGANLAAALFKTAVFSLLRFDRRILKRYLGIETPLYRLWWRNHSEYLQRQLDYDRSMREGFELGRVI